LKRFVFLSLSLLLLLILIPGCFTAATTPPAGTPPAIIVFSNNPATINAGETSTLLWNVTGATSVSIDQGIGQVNVAGFRPVAPTASAVYTIIATNSAGTVTKSVTTTVNSAPPLPVGVRPVITAFISNLNPDGTSTLAWNVAGAASVSIDQGIGRVDFVGIKVVSPTISTVYTISATNSFGTVTGSTVTTVNSASYPIAPLPFAITSVLATSLPSTFTGVCPKTFIFYATFTANGPGTATYRWERNDLRFTDIQNITFTAAGTQSTTMQWDLGETASGYYRAHVITPNDLSSLPVFYTLQCN